MSVACPIRYGLALLAATAIPAAAQQEGSRAGDGIGVPQFVEQAASAGIDHQYRGPFEFFVGGGAASFDCNNDRMPDVFIAGGQAPAKLYANISQPGGEIEFLPVPILAGALDNAIGAYPVNLDNDAYTDLVVVRLGENYLLRGGPDCSFTKANAQYSFDGGDQWTTGFTAIWEQDAAFPTLAFGNYIDREAPGSPWGTCADNLVVRSTGPAAAFADTYPLSPGYCSLSITMTDWNNTGQFDIRLTNDRQYYRGGQEQLWSLNAGGEPSEYKTENGWQELIIWGMGIAEADLNGDGRPEYALTSMGDTRLQTLDPGARPGQPAYRDIAFERGTTAQRPYQGDNSKASTGWHAQFADFNNDARTDLFIAKGNVERMPEFAAIDPDNLLLGKADGSFAEYGGVAGIALPRRGRGAVVEDFNLDGMLDLLVVNREEPVSLFRNLGVKNNAGFAPGGNFLQIELNNGAINPDAIGAKLSIKTGDLIQSYTVRVGGGHASGQLGPVHFGLGDAQRAELRIKWPNTGWSQPYDVRANSFVILERGASAVKYWTP